jgi:hypothetical protein
LTAFENQLVHMEKTLMLGRGRWIADFTESFRNWNVGDVTFDAFIQGNTRMKGFLLSRLFSATVNPNYQVGCYIISTDRVKDIDRKSLLKMLHAVRASMKENEMKWAWLFILCAKVADFQKKLVESIRDQSIGIALLDVDSKNIVSSDSYIGKQAKRFIKL